MHCTMKLVGMLNGFLMNYSNSKYGLRKATDKFSVKEISNFWEKQKH